MGFFDFLKRKNSYIPIFEYDDIKLKIKNLLEERLDDKLSDKKEFIEDIFIAIYKESNLNSDEFITKFTNNIKTITIDFCENNIDGKYEDLTKKIIINNKFFINGEIKNFLGDIVLNEKDSKKYNEYCILRTIIHEGLHCISANDFIDLNNSSKSLVILDELKTVKLESEIFNKYFSNKYKINKEIFDRNIHELEFYSRKNTTDNNFYAVPNNLDYKGYKVINNSAEYIDFIDKNFNDVYWGKMSIKETNLDNDVFIEFSKKAEYFNETIANNGYRLDNLAFYDYLKSFYKCIDFQIKTGSLDKESYLDLKESIINNRFEFPKKEFTNDSYIKNYEDSLNFDIFYLNKIEKENLNILGIEENYDKSLIDKMSTHFAEQSYDTDINSSIYINKIELEI